MNNNSVFPTEPSPAPANEIATRFCTENVNSPDYDKIRELETLNYYDQLWIRRSIDERDKGKSNVPNSYEVMSRTGGPIFKVVQTLENSQLSESPNSKSPFKLSIFDMRSGNEVMKVVAKQGADSVVVFAKQKHFQYHGIGKIIRIRKGNAYQGPSYNVRGASNGKVVIKVNGGYCFLYKKAVFNVCTPDNTQCYGKIMKDIESDDNTYRTIDSPDALYKISFPIDISMVSKALILATTLVLDYDYFECGTKEVRSDFLVMSIGLAFVTIIVVMLIVILSVSVTNKLGSIGKSNSTRNELDNQYELLETTTARIR